MHSADARNETHNSPANQSSHRVVSSMVAGERKHPMNTTDIPSLVVCQLMDRWPDSISSVGRLVSVSRALLGAGARAVVGGGAGRGHDDL